LIVTKASTSRCKNSHDVLTEQHFAYSRQDKKKSHRRELSTRCRYLYFRQASWSCSTWSRWRLDAHEAMKLNRAQLCFCVETSLNQYGARAAVINAVWMDSNAISVLKCQKKVQKGFWNELGSETHSFAIKELCTRQTQLRSVVMKDARLKKLLNIIAS